MKLCKDCKWFDGHYVNCVCDHPKNKQVCLVTGKEEFKQSHYGLRSCSVLPSEDYGCGKEGLWWEPKCKLQLNLL